MAQVHWSVNADDDLNEIKRSLARYSAVYAVRLVAQIIAVVDRLEDFPLLGRAVNYPALGPCRVLVVANYLVIYSAEDDIVTVLHIVEGHRNIERVLRQP